MNKVELNKDIVSRFEKAQLQVTNLVWLPSVFNTKSLELKNILNSFDSENQFRSVVPQIPSTQEVRLYDVDFMLEVFTKHNIYGVFAECRVPVRYNLANNENGTVVKTNPSYILLGYANSLEELVDVLEDGSLKYKEQDMKFEEAIKNFPNTYNTLHKLVKG